MSTFPIFSGPPASGLPQTQESISLSSIRKFRETTIRGSRPRQFADDATELEFYLNQTMFDLSVRVGEINRYLKNEARVETAPPEVINQLSEILKELRFCSDIGNFAISQLLPLN